MLARSIRKKIEADLHKKVVVIAGPRQSGKTTMARSITNSFDYLNYDSIEDRELLLQKKWDRRKRLIIFDELHKMPKWKSWLKGVFDKEGVSPQLLVTGSARLNALRNVGDSLAGRYFYFRLHPFDLKEIIESDMRISVNEAMSRLLSVGGYPEPFLNGEINEYRRWRQGHLNVIIRQDLLDLEAVRDLRSIELLLQLLRTKVGSPVSINALANDLHKDHKTIQRWLMLLEDLFVVFKVSPYSRNIARAVRKEPKYYFFDTGFVEGEACKLENLVACALLKESHFKADVEGRPYQLHFLKVKGGREIDFLMLPEDADESPVIVEVKQSDPEASANFKLFSPAFKGCRQIQLVADLRREFVTQNGVEVRRAADWLANFKI